MVDNSYKWTFAMMAVLFVVAHCGSICKSIFKIIKVVIFPIKVVENSHFIIGIFSATGIRAFPYSICNLNMNICTSTTLALKKVSSYIPFSPLNKANYLCYMAPSFDA